MPRRDLMSGGIVGFVLLAVVIVLAIRACRSTDTECAVADSESSAA